MAKAKRGFMDYQRTYDTSEGFGNREAWRKAFHDTMGFEEAETIIKGQKRTSWDILGLTNGVTYSQDDIKQAFRRKAKDLHPDRALQNEMTVEQATEAFKELMAAYTILKR